MAGMGDKTQQSSVNNAESVLNAISNPNTGVFNQLGMQSLFAPGGLAAQVPTVASLQSQIREKPELQFMSPNFGGMTATQPGALNQVQNTNFGLDPRFTGQQNAGLATTNVGGQSLLGGGGLLTGGFSSITDKFPERFGGQAQSSEDSFAGFAKLQTGQPSTNFKQQSNLDAFADLVGFGEGSSLKDLLLGSADEAASAASQALVNTPGGTKVSQQLKVPVDKLPGTQGLGGPKFESVATGGGEAANEARTLIANDWEVGAGTANMTDKEFNDWVSSMTGYDFKNQALLDQSGQGPELESAKAQAQSFYDQAERPRFTFF